MIRVGGKLMPECLLGALQDVGLYLFEEFGAEDEDAAFSSTIF